jgi:hypothetical protein
LIPVLEPKRSRRALAWKAAFDRISDLDGGLVWQQAKTASEKLGVSLGRTSASLQLIRVEVAGSSN